MVVDIDVSKVFKTFMIIDENYKCPANCPFCTAKITKWEKTNHDWNCLGKQLEFLNSMNMKFENLTVSGNGEPCMLDIDILTNIKNQFLKHQNMFEYGRIQTCGELFNLNDKWELFKDFCFEITRCDIDPIKNAEILGYKPYDDLINFKNSKIMFNLALLKENNHKTVEDIKHLIDNYPNVISVTAKILNVNTLDDGKDSLQSKWIIEHGVPKDQTNDVVELLNNNFEQSKGYDGFTDRYEWLYKGIPIILYARRADYGTANIVYYEGKLMDYHFNTLNFK